MLDWVWIPMERERDRKRERELDGQTPWSGLKCCQWQSDVPLNRITLKVSCHHIPASHYQGHGSLWDDRERSGFPPFLWTLLELPVMPDRKCWRERTDEVLLVPWRWCLWTGELKGGRKLSPSRRHRVTNQKWISADFTMRRLLHPVCKYRPCQRYSRLSHHRRALAKLTTGRADRWRSQLFLLTS